MKDLNLKFMRLITVNLLLNIITQFTPNQVFLTWAKDNPILMAQKVNCNSPQTTVEMNQCSSQEAKAADQKLNQVYKLLMSKITGTQKQRLITAQKVWINFRDKTCDYEQGQFEGGTLATSTYSACLTKITKQRIVDLEGYFKMTVQ